MVTISEDCTIKGKTLTGSIHLNGGTLTLTGGTIVHRKITCFGPTPADAPALNVKYATVGDIDMEFGGNVQIGPDSVVKALSVVNSGSVKLQGEVLNKVYVEGSRTVNMSGTVSGSLTVNNNSGAIKVCSARLMGGVSIDGHQSGDISFDKGKSCKNSFIVGDVQLSNG